MKRLAGWLSLALLSVAVAGMLAATATATTTRIPIASQEACDNVISGPTAFWVAGNTTHLRGMVIACTEVGTTGAAYITGINTITYNSDLNLVTGKLVMWGTANLALDAYPGSGFAGEWTSKSSVAQGYGVFAGWKMVVSLDTPGFAIGYVFSPGDK